VSDLFLPLVPLVTGSTTKLLVLDRVEFSQTWLDYFCSLHIEHVSPDLLMKREICRRSPLGQLAEQAQRSGTVVPAEATIAVMRRWFMARKPDAGFALQGFPATLLQAHIFDEWLDVRDESLNAVVHLKSATTQVEIIEYYRTYGLLQNLEFSGASCL
jgi:adenylate kinase